MAERARDPSCDALSQHRELQKGFGAAMPGGSCALSLSPVLSQCHRG